MALTRKLLEGMGIEDKQIQAIIDAHDESISGLKAKRDEYKELADKVPDLQKQLEEAKAASSDGSEWQRKYNDEHKAFEDFKGKVSAEKAEAEKAKAYRELLAAAGIDPKRVDAIMRVTDLSGIVVEDGKLKDSDRLQEEARKEWSDFVVRTHTEGSNPATPPKAKGKLPDGADPEIAARMQARHERLYGKDTSDKE